MVAAWELQVARYHPFEARALFLSLSFCLVSSPHSNNSIRLPSLK